MFQDTAGAPPRKRITLERNYRAKADEVWELWTTKDGIEEWWGPDGFSVTVHRLELEVGGRVEYSMRATAAPQIAFLEKAGMPVVTENRWTYTELEPVRRLGFTSIVDFVPGVAPYTMATSVEISPTASGVRMLVTLDPMHDAHWTDLAVRGWESQLERLAQSLAKRA